MEVRSVNNINPKTDEAHWTITYKNKGKFMKPFNDNNPEQSWKQCIVKNSLQLYKYNLWKCPPIAYLQDVLKKFNLNNDSDWEPYLEYEGISANTTDKKLEEFLYKKEDWICTMCPAQPETLTEKTVL